MVCESVANISDFDRVYALSGGSKVVPIVCGIIIVAQWAIALYLIIHSFEGSNQVALLLSPPVFPLPTVPAVDAYNGEGCPMILGTLLVSQIIYDSLLIYCYQGNGRTYRSQ